MSHPSINRWGLNLFWYRFWYNDKISALLNHQDSLIDNLIITYLHYGILTHKNFFFSKYWYLSNINFKENSLKIFNTKYFRTVEYKNKTIGEYRTYKLRNKVKNLYYSKLWLFRYQNWLVINFYCYQPLKKTTKKSIIRKNLANLFSFSSMPKFTDTIRYKTIIFYAFNSILINSAYYKF
jgi:hypothetical protein